MLIRERPKSDTSNSSWVRRQWDRLTVVGQYILHDHRTRLNLNQAIAPVDDLSLPNHEYPLAALIGQKHFPGFARLAGITIILQRDWRRWRYRSGRRRRRRRLPHGRHWSWCRQRFHVEDVASRLVLDFAARLQNIGTQPRILGRILRRRRWFARWGRGGTGRRGSPGAAAAKHTSERIQGQGKGDSQQCRHGDHLLLVLRADFQRCVLTLLAC